jgi:hypothetical protein
MPPVYNSEWKLWKQWNQPRGREPPESRPRKGRKQHGDNEAHSGRTTGPRCIMMMECQ